MALCGMACDFMLPNTLSLTFHLPTEKKRYLNLQTECLWNMLRFSGRLSNLTQI